MFGTQTAAPRFQQKKSTICARRRGSKHRKRRVMNINGWWPALKNLRQLSQDEIRERAALAWMKFAKGVALWIYPNLDGGMN